MKLPQSIPILTAITARVAGSEIADLIRSPARLARALADTQIVVGHDGVLCLFDPWLLLGSCTSDVQMSSQPSASSQVDGLTPPGEVAARLPLSSLLETIEPLRHHLPGGVKIYAAFSGPALLRTQLRETLASGGERAVPAAADPDFGYVREVLKGLVRSFLELGADGIALLEQSMPETAPELAACYRIVRKLTAFYDAGYIVFNLSPGERPESDFKAHCVFDLPPPGQGNGPVFGRSGCSYTGPERPLTSAGDVPVDTPFEDLKKIYGRAAA
jgi:hypothetical protein